MSTAKDARRVVIKIGSSTLTHPSGHINIRLLEQLVKTMADIKNSGRQLVLVSSGAIAVGVGQMGLQKRPDDIPGKQAAAAVGQCELMYIYDRYFSEYNHIVGQVLLTNDVLENPDSRENVRNTFEALLSRGVIPVVNENDTVATDEIKVGDNDTLSAIVAQLIGADCLIILSDIDGFYTGNPAQDPTATLVEEIAVIDDSIYAAAGGAGTSRGTGGMLTKLHAAKLVQQVGGDTYIISGQHPARLYDLMEGQRVGTHFAGKRVEADG